MPRIPPLLLASFGLIAIAPSAHPQASSTTAADLGVARIQLDDHSFSQFFADAAPSPAALRLETLSAPLTTGAWQIKNSLDSGDAFTEQDRALADRQSIPNLDPDDEGVREDFYALELEFNQEVTTKTLEHSTQIGVQLSKNPLALSGLGPLPPHALRPVPLPFSVADWHSQKNDLQVYFQQEVAIAERFNLFLYGELYPAIADPTVVPEWPTVDAQSQSELNLEMEASYQLTDAFSVYSYVNREDKEVLDLELGLSYQLTEIISIYGSVMRSLLPTEVTDANGNGFPSAIDDTLKVGISAALLDDNLEAGLGVYRTAAQNVAVTDDASVAESETNISQPLGQYTRQGIELSLFGELQPGWSVEAIYTYSDTQQPEVPPHAAELITTYEIKQGRFEGWGVTNSLVWENRLLANQANVQPTYLRADTGIFYRGQGFRAFLSLENLFAVDEESWAIVGTIMFQF